MLSTQQKEVLHLFDDSICPDPDVSIFLGFTMFTLLWMFYQSIAASQPRAPSSPRGTVATVFLSATYVAVLAIQLLDGCWFAVLYSWWIPKVASGEWYSRRPSILLNWMITWPILCLMSVFLLAGLHLWIITLVRSVKQLMLLWKRCPGSVLEITVGKEKAPSPRTTS